MKTIFKYHLAVRHGMQSILLPEGAKVISVVEQRNVVCVYAYVESSEETLVERQFFTAYTGMELPKDILSRIATRFIGTVCLMMGELVVHVFEVGRNFDERGSV